MRPLNNVIIFGGTHGNEWTGIFVIEKYQKQLEAEFPDLNLNFILANPEAYKINRRFKDEDLNRAFQFLHEERKNSYEHERAKEIKELISEVPAFIIDLHTTTANMGNTLIISHENKLNLNISSEVLKLVPGAKAILSPDPNRKYLASQSEFGLMIEVGPVANGLIESKTLQGTYELLRQILTALSKQESLKNSEIEVYEEVQDVHYPRDINGEMMAFIHENFQGQDFIPLRNTYTPFRTFSGEAINMTSPGELFPIFINEAAYYFTGLAYTLCRKRTLNF